MNDFKDYLLTDLVIGESISINFTPNNNYYQSERYRYLQVIELIDQETGEILVSQEGIDSEFLYFLTDLSVNFVPKAGTNYLVRVGGFDLSKMTENYTLTTGKSVLGINDESNLDIDVYEKYDLAISSSNIPAVGVLGEEIQVSWTITNQDIATITASDWWYDHIYISDDEYLDESDILIFQYYQDLYDDLIFDEPPELLYRPLEGGSSQKTTELISLNQEKLTPGDRHLLIALDNNHNLRETDETDNILSVPITLIDPKDIDRDLKVTSFTIPDTIYTYNDNSEETVDVSWTVSNLGADNTLISHWQDKLYLSQDKYFDSSDISLDDAVACDYPLCGIDYGKVNTYHRAESLEGQSSYTVNITLDLGGIPYLLEDLPVGEAYLLLVTDAQSKLLETDETNNTFTVPINMNDESITVDNERKNALLKNLTIHRFYNPTSGVHFYTGDEVEKDYVNKNLNNYTYEGESYLSVAQDSQAEEVYRFFNSQTGVHLYTTSETEKDFIIDNLNNFDYEGVKFYAYETQIDDSVPVYRFYEPSIGVHFYTPNEAEKIFVDESLSNYTYEGIAYYALSV